MNRRDAAVDALSERLGYRFKDAGLLEQALTHASVNQRAEGSADNERLEFLGDRVLGLVMAEALMQRRPAETEGDLSRRLHGLVSGRTCAEVARGWEVGPALRLPGAESKRGARDQQAFLADACEAIIAAVYRDGGLEAARALVLAAWGDRIEADAAPAPPSPKTGLQEWALARGKPLPGYEVTDRSGPDHSPRFQVRVLVDGLEPATGEGPSRKEAEKAAAQALLAREGASA